MTKPWLIVSLALNIAFITVTLRKAIESRGLQQPASAYSRFHIQRVAVFEGLPVPRGALLFFGDSLIENCEWSELLGMPIANRGISGDDTASLLTAVPALGDLRHLKSILLVAGANDLGEGIEIEPFVGRYRALVNTLHAAAPGAQIIVHGLLPVNPALDPSLQSFPPRIRAANARLSRLASEMGFRYFEAYTAFADSSGFLDRRYTIDGLHPNGAGYRVWADLLHPLLTR